MEKEKKIPKFLEGEILPEQYFGPVDPYKSSPTCKINLGKLVAYAKEQEKTQWELTKEEINMFKE